MFAHIPQQEDARRQRRVRSSSKRLSGFQRIATLLWLAVPAALLLWLSVPASPVAAKTLAAPDPTTCGTTVAELEQCTFQLINSYRADQGLAPYLWDDNLANAARAHSELWLTYGEQDCPPIRFKYVEQSNQVTNAMRSLKSMPASKGGAFKCKGNLRSYLERTRLTTRA